MVNLSSKTLALVVSAIKNMRESKGSSSRDILNYISSVHDIPQDVAKRQMVAALKRGVAHGIIKRTDGYYSLPTDTEAECLEVAAQELGLLDLCCRKKKRESRKRRGGGGCKKSSSKRRKRSGRKGRGGKGRRGRSGSRKRRGKRGCGCKSKSRRGRSGRRGRRSKRGKSGCKPKRKSRRSKKNKCDPRALDNEKISKCRNEQLNMDGFDNDERGFNVRHTSKARSRERSKSCSRNGNVVSTS